MIYSITPSKNNWVWTISTPGFEKTGWSKSRASACFMAGVAIGGFIATLEKGLDPHRDSRIRAMWVLTFEKPYPKDLSTADALAEVDRDLAVALARKANQ